MGKITFRAFWIFLATLAISIGSNSTLEIGTARLGCKLSSSSSSSTSSSSNSTDDVESTTDENAKYGLGGVSVDFSGGEEEEKAAKFNPRIKTTTKSTATHHTTPSTPTKEAETTLTETNQASSCITQEPAEPEPAPAATSIASQNQQNTSTETTRASSSPSDNTSRTTMKIPTTINTNINTSPKNDAQNPSFPCNFTFSQNPSTNPCATEIQIIQKPFSVSEWKYGFFNDTPNFFINPKNFCVKNSTTVEICGKVSKLTSPDEISIPSVFYPYFPHTLPKCCPMEAYLTTEETREATCQTSDYPPWKPESMKAKGIHPNYNVFVPLCSSTVLILPYQLEPNIIREKNPPITFKDVRVLESGEVETRDTGNHKWKKLEPNTYCIDGFTPQLTSNETEPFNGTAADSFMLIRCKAGKSDSKKIKDLIIAVGVFISSFVLLFIVIVYGLVWNQQNIHGWTSGAFSLALFFWFFCTGMRHLYKKDGQGDVFCIFIAVVTHFFRISTFSWMLVMNFDLWSTISSMTAISQRTKGQKRFLYYFLVALAIPTIVVTISLIIEHNFSLFDDRVIRPNYGKSRCYLDHTALKAYAIYPSIILFLPNLIFIFLTLKFLIDVKKDTKKIRESTNWKATAAQNKKDRAQTILYIKLLVIMGVSWIFDIISGLSDSDAGEISWYWMIFDIYNIFQPFFLFFLFVCKKTIREQLNEKYSLFKAGFKWLDVHLPRCFSTRTTRDQSESRSTKSTTFTTITTIREEKYV